MADPIQQFQIVNYFSLGKIGPVNFAFTNSALYMAIAVGLTAALMLGATAGRQLVPGRMQSMAELAYEFVADTTRNTIGEGGMRFFPLVFSIFMFILISNVVGLIPYNFTVASQLIITVALALLVFVTVLIYGFWKNGLRFLNLFVPKGIPVYILPAIVPIDVFSFFVRPVSHSVRLFANMLAGHRAVTPLKLYRNESRLRSIMIEVRRDLYMDEQTGKMLPTFDAIKQHVTEGIERIGGRRTFEGAFA